MRNINKSYLTFSLFLLSIIPAYSQLEQEVNPMLSYQIESILPHKIEFLQHKNQQSGAVTRDLSLDEQLVSFYIDRGFRSAWFNASGQLNASSVGLLRYMQSDERFQSQLMQPLQTALLSYNSEGFHDQNDQINTLAKLEVGFTKAFLRMAEVNLHGWVSPENLKGNGGWYIAARSADLLEVLEKAIATKDVIGQLNALLPQDPKYRKLYNYLEELKSIAALGGWPEVPQEMVDLELNDTSNTITILQNRLAISGDINKSYTRSMVYDSLIFKGVTHFQRRHGLKVDGKVGKNTLFALNIPVEERIKQIEVNLERAKWLPNVSQGKAIWVNIPEYMLYLLDDGETIQEHKVVVGAINHKTLSFSSKLQNIVVNPYWNVPVSIFKNELTPKAKNSTDYLADRNYEMITHSGATVNLDDVDWNDPKVHGQYRIRQRPGAGNALGNLKFNFANKWSIYIHDTPTQYTFTKAFRAASHGCVRLHQPEKLADSLLETNPKMQGSSIRQLIQKGETVGVTVSEDVAVHIVYMTAWVDEAGELQMRDDIYGRDNLVYNSLSTVM